MKNKVKIVKVLFNYFGENVEDLNKVSHAAGDGKNEIPHDRIRIVDLSPLYAEIILNEDFRQIKTIVRRYKLDKIYNGIDRTDIDALFLEFFLREFDKISLINNKSTC